jgi:multisubunit Na+/H+ antiporter MnhC subunit
MEVAIITAIIIGWIVTIGGLVLVYLTSKKKATKHSH